MPNIIIRALSITGLLLLLTPLAAQDHASVYGVVTDSLTQEPVAYANVFLAGTSMGAVSDINGQFAINNIPQAGYDLQISYIGYETYRSQLHLTTINPVFIEAALVDIIGGEILYLVGTTRFKQAYA